MKFYVCPYQSRDQIRRVSISSAHSGTVSVRELLARGSVSALLIQAVIDRQTTHDLVDIYLSSQ